MTAGKTLPISALRVLNGPQLRGHYRLDTVNPGPDLDQDWAGARYVHDILIQVSGAINLCTRSDSDETPTAISGLCDVRESRQESAWQTRDLRRDIHEALSGAFEKAQMLQRQTRTDPMSKSLTGGTRQGEDGEGKGLPRISRRRGTRHH